MNNQEVNTETNRDAKSAELVTHPNDGYLEPNPIQSRTSESKKLKRS